MQDDARPQADNLTGRQPASWTTKQEENSKRRKP